MSAIFVGNAKLFAFYFKNLLNPFSLPRELYDESAMAAKMATGAPFEVVVDEGRDYVEGYAEGLERLAAELHGLGAAGVPMDFPTKRLVFWVIRLVCVGCAFAGSFELTFLASLLQFFALPYSFFVAIGYGLETVFSLYTGHVLVFPLLNFLLRSMLPAELNLTFTIKPWFLVTFIIVDQVLCAYCHIKTHKGNATSVTTSGIMRTVIYGFLNCKTYYLILLPLTFGMEFPVLAWIIDAALGLSSRIFSFTGRFWQVLYYHVHLMAHLKHVYPDAHKFHHHLSDCTPFDAHIFGSGAPEEWLILMTDLALALGLGCLPASLSYNVLSVSWHNKCHFHSRSDKPAGHADNFHADHHALHTANFGLSPPFELFMKTLHQKVAEKAEVGGFAMTRVEDGRAVRLQFSPVVTESLRARRSLEPGYRTRAGGA